MKSHSFYTEFIKYDIENKIYVCAKTRAAESCILEKNGMLLCLPLFQK